MTVQLSVLLVMAVQRLSRTNEAALKKTLNGSSNMINMRITHKEKANAPDLTTVSIEDGWATSAMIPPQKKRIIDASAHLRSGTQKLMSSANDPQRVETITAADENPPALLLVSLMKSGIIK